MLAPGPATFNWFTNETRVFLRKMWRSQISPPGQAELSKLRSEVKRKSVPVVGFEDARGKEVSFSVAGLPSWNRRGGRDLKKNIAKHPLKGADGVVAHRHSSGMHSDRWCVSGHPAAREQKHSLASSPPVPGGELARPNRFRNLDKFCLDRRGGCAIKRIAAFLAGADGVVDQAPN